MVHLDCKSIFSNLDVCPGLNFHSSLPHFIHLCNMHYMSRNEDCATLIWFAKAFWHIEVQFPRPRVELIFLSVEDSSVVKCR